MLHVDSSPIVAPSIRVLPQTVRVADRDAQSKVNTPEHADSQHWTPNSIPASVKFCEWHDATQDWIVKP